ncbi:HAMP domain-containing protein [Lachnospiraceae bacterium AM23-2LB]|nr:HAMP domain-containing protein [Lachnospiraceae bacterium AM23-2LB]
MIMKRKITWKQLFSSSVIRVMCIIIAVMIPVNVVTILLGKMAVNRAEEQFASETKGALDLYMLQVEDAMKRAAWKTQQIAVDDVDFAKINSKKITTTTEYYDELQSVVRLKEVMNKAIDDNIFAAGMYAFFPEKEIKIVESNYSSYQTELFEQINRIIEEKEIQKVGYWEVVDLETTDIALYVGKHQNAYFGAWFDLNQILRRIVKEDGNPQIQAFISEDRQIYSEKNAENIDLETVLNNPKKAGYIVIRTENKYADFSLIQVISRSTIKNNFSGMTQILSWSMILVLLAIPVILYVLRRWMIVPLNQLSSAMKRIEHGDTEFRITEKSAGSEFEQINKNFNRMLDEMSELKIDVYEQQLEKEKIRRCFLSQQIQPHFILNAMNILYSYEQDEYPLIQKMILCLSQYFRYIVNANTDFVELKNEMLHIRNYFEIQRARYPEEFFAIVEWDEELDNCLIPPLLIQNFVENAIKHSLMIGNSIDIFVIAKKMGDEKIQIFVADTGKGISDEILEKIKRFRETKQYQDGLGVGIQNAIERLEVLYEGKAELKIGRDRPNGTRVELILERKEKGDA